MHFSISNYYYYYPPSLLLQSAVAIQERNVKQQSNCLVLQRLLSLANPPTADSALSFAPATPYTPICMSMGVDLSSKAVWQSGIK